MRIVVSAIGLIAMVSSLVPSDVENLARVCGTSADVYIPFRSDNISKNLRRLEGLAQRLIERHESASDIKEMLCSIAAGDPDHLNEEEFNALVAQINHRLKDWPRDRWQSQFEKKCARLGVMIQMRFEHDNDAEGSIFDVDELDGASTAHAFAVSKTDDQLVVLCQLLGRASAEYPKEEVATFKIQASKVNNAAPELGKICPFSSLRNRGTNELGNSEKILHELTSAELRSIPDLCQTPENLENAIRALRREDEVQHHRRAMTPLYSKCSKVVPVALWKTVSDEMLSKFDEVVSLNISKKKIETVCNIFKTYMQTRSPETEIDAQGKALKDLDAIKAKHGLGIMRLVHQFTRGIQREFM